MKFSVSYSLKCSLFRLIQSLAAPQVNLPDDVVAPVLPPYPSLKSFDIPKLPSVGAKLLNGGLNNSHGSNGGDTCVS